MGKIREAKVVALGKGVKFGRLSCRMPAVCLSYMLILYLELQMYLSNVFNTFDNREPLRSSTIMNVRKFIASEQYKFLALSFVAETEYLSHSGQEATRKTVEGGFKI